MRALRDLYLNTRVVRRLCRSATSPSRCSTPTPEPSTSIAESSSRPSTARCTAFRACTQCADDCLSEKDVASLVKCIRIDLDCADICAATARVLSRQTEYDANLTRAQLQACVVACQTCAEECEQHAEHGMQHCVVCAAECRRCETACQELLQAIA